MRETKTIQCHPDRDNETIRFYENFGWEVQSNQRCQEKEGGYNVTFNKITFTREKNFPGRERMCKLEEEARRIKNKSVEDYLCAKDKYGYDEKTKLGERPKIYELPKFAQMKKFFIPFTFFLICAICALLSAPSVFRFMEAGTYEQGENALFVKGITLFVTGWATVILFFVSLSKIKFLKGLKGSKREKAIEKHNKSIEAQNAYDSKAKAFLCERYKEIVSEAEALLGTSDNS